MVALEVMADQNGFLCLLLKIYVKGRWPLGVLADKTLMYTDLFPSNKTENDRQ